MEPLAIVNANVKQLLIDHPEMRDPLMRKQAHIRYWQMFDGLGEFGIPIKQYPYLTSSETISRAIRKIQEFNPNLRPNPQGKEIRKSLETKHYQEYKNNNLFKDEYNGGDYK